jgi:hypothetical protein
MAQGMMNNPEAVPIDIWLMRMLGSIDSTTPGKAPYRTTREAFSNHVRQRFNDTPWNAMQRGWGVTRSLGSAGRQGLAPGQYLEKLGFQGIPDQPLSRQEFDSVRRAILALYEGS